MSENENNSSEILNKKRTRTNSSKSNNHKSNSKLITNKFKFRKKNTEHLTTNRFTKQINRFNFN